MDLIADIKPQNSTVEIKHPVTGEATGLVIELRPMHDPAVKAVQKRIGDRRLKQAARNKALTTDELENNTSEMLAATMIGWQWKGDASFNGKKLEFTPGNVAVVLAVDWIAGQIDEALGDNSRFFVKSGTN